MDGYERGKINLEDAFQRTYGLHQGQELWFTPGPGTRNWRILLPAPVPAGCSTAAGAQGEDRTVVGEGACTGAQCSGGASMWDVPWGAHGSPWCSLCSSC